ncbi:MAG: flagellar protein FlbB [Rhodobacteraceae bacterium HLUCCA08]|nr:MAG: flagellar protein FlbB [Rhodobacteraceae bacterium HLUCCA08]
MKRRRLGGVLTVTIVLFVASFGIRVAIGAGPVLAEAEDAADDTATPVAETCPEPPNPELLAALRDREARLDEQEQRIADRLQALRIAEEQLALRRAELEAAEASLEQTIATVESAAENDVSNLVAVYEQMKAPDAAELFTEMDPTFAAGFLGRMRPDAAAAIMAELEPANAYTISVILAGQNADAPTE